MGVTKEDIKDGSEAEFLKNGYVYTRLCGWIDLGHAIPGETRDLWRKIQNEQDDDFDRWEEPGYFFTSYGQFMRHKKLSAGVRVAYRIKKGLGLKEKKSVTLGIFLDVSGRFETLQGSWPFCWLEQVNESSYSLEDLISNLIGFYRAVEPGRRYIEMSQPVSKKEALEIYERHKSTIATLKNHSLRPLLFHLGTEGPVYGTLPLFLNTIRPAKPGELYGPLLGDFDVEKVLKPIS